MCCDSVADNGALQHLLQATSIIIFCGEDWHVRHYFLLSGSVEWYLLAKVPSEVRKIASVCRADDSRLSKSSYLDLVAGATIPVRIQPVSVETAANLHFQGNFEPEKKDPEAPDFWASELDLVNVLRARLIEDYQTLNMPFPAKDVVYAIDNVTFSILVKQSNPLRAISTSLPFDTKDFKSSICCQFLLCILSNHSSDTAAFFLLIFLLDCVKSI